MSSGHHERLITSCRSAPEYALHSPSCFDLIFTEQPNLIIGSGTRLDKLYNHHLLPKYMARPLLKIWHFSMANIPY